MSGLDELSQEGSPELLSDVMTKLIKDSNSSLNIEDTYDTAGGTTYPPPDGKQPPLDLHTLWKLLEKMDKEKGGEGGVGISEVDTDSADSHGGGGGGGGKMSTWELVVLQAVLLSLLIVVSLLWAFCCKKRCLTDRSTLMGEVVAFARKISGGSTKSELPPSYSKTDLTDVGLTIDDHLNPPPTYDRAAALNMMELERKSGVSGGSRAPSYRTYNSSSHASLASTNIDHIVDIENHNASSSTTTSVAASPTSPPPLASASTPKTSTSSASSSGSRKSSGSNRVTFSPGLISGPTPFRKRPASLPLVSVLVHPESRKRSTQSEGGEPSVSVCEIVAHNLNSQPRCQPMI